MSAGAFTFSDQTQSPAFRATLTPLNFEVHAFSTVQGVKSPYDFSARLGQSTLTWKGSFSANPLQSKGSLGLTDVDLTAFAPYLKTMMQLELHQGTFGVTSDYEFDASNGATQLSLTNAKADVRDVHLRGPGESEDRLSVASLEARLALFSLHERRARLDSVGLKGLRVKAARTKDGAIDLVALASPRSAPATPPSPAAAPPPPVAPGREPAPFAVQLNKATLEDAELQYADESLETRATLGLRNVNLTVGECDWPPTHPVTAGLEFDWAPQGHVTTQATATLKPFSATVNAVIENLALAPVSPWVSENLNAVISQGALGARLEVALDASNAVTASGGLRVTDFSLDDAANAPLVAWKSLSVEGLKAATAPGLDVAVQKVTWQGANLRVDIAPDGAMALAQLAKKKPAPEPEAKEAPGPAPRYAVKQLVLDNVTTSISDRSVTPAFLASIARVSGTVKDVAIPLVRPVQLQLAGRVDTAALTVAGRVLPKDKDSDVDLALKLDGYELPNTSGYTVKYVAQPIAKGKLLVDVHYAVKNRALNGTNKIVAHQLGFGERVDPVPSEATTLPLGLAVAILSDREGKIDLDVPVTGDLNDPDFHYGGVVWSALKNVIVKLATSPFSLLASLVGGDPEALKFVAFEPGQFAIPEAEVPKVSQLTRLLEERPGLSLEMRGVSDEVSDGAALRKVRFIEQSAKGRADAGATSMSEADYRLALRAAWLAKAPARGADGGAVVEPPGPLLEREVLSRVALPADALVLLEKARFGAVHDALIAAGAPAERLFSTVADAADGGQTPSAAVLVNVK